jgi:soluble lytic murein transglycosylase
MTLRRATKFVVSAALLALAGAQARGDDDPYAAVRMEFLQAYNTASAGLAEPQAQDSAALRAYPLYPYLEAARFKRDLTLLPDPAPVDNGIAGFLQRYGEQPVGRALRRAWLLELGRRQVWQTFYTQYADTSGDPVLRCDLLQARIALNLGKDLAPAIVQEWLSAKDTPPECEPAFAWLRAHQLLPASLVDQRARLALAAGNTRLANSLIPALPPEMAAPLRQWSALIAQPQREIDRLINQPELPVESAALQDGWLRLARSDPDAALQRYQPLLQARQLDQAGASPYARSLGLGLAWSRRPEALDYFARVLPADVDDRTAEWGTRAALWAGNWPRAAQAIAAMPPALREQARWRYWAARSAELQGDAASAKAGYTALLANDNYYAGLAAARLGEAYAPHQQSLTLDSAAASRLAQQPAFQRAHELLLCRLEPLAVGEWAYGFDALDPAQRSQSIGLAMRWGWYNQGIATASKQGVFNDYALLYPRPYDGPVHAAAALTGLPEDFIYAVMRQESLYDSEVVSRANAVGLLQLILETSQRTARHWQRPQPSRADLFDPATNITLGSAELRDMLGEFDNQLPVAIAAYNAGPNAAARWLPDQPRDAAVWIENIPYNETRDYVQRVLWHTLVFDWRRSGEPQKTEAWLGQVGMPQAASEPASP